MKILHLIYDHMNNPWVGGGGAVRAYEICRRLADRGHEVTVISGKYPESADYREGNLDYRFIGSSRNYLCSTFSYAFRAAGFIKTHGGEFDVIIEDFAPWNPVFSRFFTGKPVVLHLNHLEGRNILKRWSIAGVPFLLVEQFYPRLFHFVTALSEATREKVNVAGTVVIPAGIGGELLEKGAAPGNGGEGNRILYVGRLHIKNKGLDTLFTAMEQVDAGLILVGKGNDEARLREMAKRLRPGQIEFSGFVSEEKKVGLLKDGLFLLLPSRFEGWGIVVLEAAACGKPVIVSDIPELKYAVDAGFGLSFKTGDAKDLAEKMNFLLADKQLRQEMGTRAREYARNFTWDRISGDYEKFLMEIAQQSERA